MEGGGRRQHSREQIIEAQLSWVGSLVLLFETFYALAQSDFLWFVFGMSALVLYALPIASTRDAYRAVPWELALMITAPMLLHLLENSQILSERLSWWTSLDSTFFGFALATIGFLLTIEVQMYTEVRMNRPFAVFFVLMFTLATAGFWQVGIFIGDLAYGTDYQVSNRDAMMVIIWNMVGGIVMGFVYDLYLRAMSQRRRHLFGFLEVWEVPERRTS